MARNKVETINNLLCAGIANFAEKGYHGASMEEIAVEAKVNKSIIFYHFINKEQFYYTLIDSIFYKVNNSIGDRQGHDKTALENIEIYLKHLDSKIHALSRHELVLFRQELLRPSSAAITKRINLFYDTQYNLFKHIVDYAIHTGEIISLNPPAFFNQVLLLIVNRGTYLSDFHTVENCLAGDDELNQLIAILLKGLVKE
jgi:AcrR family transcriptional regulator